MYEELDKAIVESVKSGKSRFADILAEVGQRAGVDPSRQVDRRLQAMRKKGILKCGDGWKMP